MVLAYAAFEAAVVVVYSAVLVRAGGERKKS